MHKTCTGCKQSLPISEFNKCSKSKDGARGRCKKCRSIKDINRYNKAGSKSYAYAKKYRNSNKDKKAVYNRKYKEANKDKILNEAKRWRENNVNKISSSRRKCNYKRRYNTTIEEYDRMFEEQDGVCYICGEPSLAKRLAVDHNHETGKVRGLLCARCNIWLGIFENNEELFKQFKIYLKERS